MFDIAVDECGRTCAAPELVAGKSETQRGNAKKRKYFCVACVNAKHPVFLKIRNEKQLLVGNSRNYTALAWFSHHGSGGGGNCEMDRPSGETKKHWHAKHILSEHASRYWFITEKCTGCDKHTKIENGVQATGRVEFRETTCGGNVYCFDAVLMRGEPDKMVVTTVLEVWATHETSEDKRQYCWDMGYMFGEFHADHVVEAYGQAAANTIFHLENLKIRLFECPDCAQLALQKKKDILLVTANAEKARVWAEEALQFVMAEEEEAAELVELQIQAAKLCVIAQKAYEQQCALDETEFYETTCVGAETRIIQVQEELYSNYMLQHFYTSLQGRIVLPHVPLGVFTGMDPDITDATIMRIGVPWIWFQFFRKISMDKAEQRYKLIRGGKLRLNYVVYEKGISFKCICNKWVHPVKSHPSCVRVHKAQVNVDDSDEDGYCYDDKFSSNRGEYCHSIKVCGLCSDICVFCGNKTLHTYHKSHGCCYACECNMPGRIRAMQSTIQRRVICEISRLSMEIRQICSDDPFRGFTDFAVEYQVRLQRELQLKKDAETRYAMQCTARALVKQEQQRKQLMFEQLALYEANRKQLMLKKLAMHLQHRKQFILEEENRKQLVLAEENRKQLILQEEHKKLAVIQHDLASRKRRYPSSDDRISRHRKLRRFKFAKYDEVQKQYHIRLQDQMLHMAYYENFYESSLAHAAVFLTEIHSIAKQERYMAFLYEQAWAKYPSRMFKGVLIQWNTWPESTIAIEYNKPNEIFWYRNDGDLVSDDPDWYIKETMGITTYWGGLVHAREMTNDKGIV